MLAVLVSSDDNRLEDLQQGLMRDGQVRAVKVRNGLSALELVRTRQPDLVVVDAKISDFKPLELVSEILRARAMTHTAVVSNMDEEDFHELSEGLGVLKQLPDPPDTEDGAKLLQAWKAVA